MVTQQPVVIVAHANDKLAREIIHQLVTDGRGNTRRPRRFEEVGTPNGRIHYQGQVDLHLKNGAGEYVLHRQVPVEAIITPHPETETRRDIVIRGAERSLGGRRYATSPRYLAHARYAVPLRQDLVRESQTVLVFPQDKTERHATMKRTVANAIAAHVTDQLSWDSAFLSFPGGFEGRDWQTVNAWVNQDRPIELVTACCLNATKDRHRIVDQFAPEITSLLVRCARAAFSRLSPRVTEWSVSTFGPGDLEWLGELGMTRVLLPYMWDAPAEIVRGDMQQNYDLMQGLVNQLDAALPFPVRLTELNAMSGAVDMARLIEASAERSVKMMAVLSQDPPLIFKTIEADLRRRNPGLPDSEFRQLVAQEQYTRVRQEAFLYLLDTLRHGTPDTLGPDDPVSLCVGLEVHGGYIATGQLNEVDGKYLPVAWLPGCVRQHWGPWVLENGALKKERAQLAARLSAIGY